MISSSTSATGSPMSNRRRVGVVLLLLIGLPAGCAAWIGSLNFFAEHKAQQFCRRIKVGSELEPIVAAYAAEHPGPTGKESIWHYALENGHRFRFPGLFLDAAYCDVRTDKQGRVVSASSYFQAD